jgi:hypothetical protein
MGFEWSSLCAITYKRKVPRDCVGFRTSVDMEKKLVLAQFEQPKVHHLTDGTVTEDDCLLAYCAM